MTRRKYAYAACRSRVPGHDWVPYAGTDWVPTHGFGEEESCTRCGTVRHCIISIRGDKSPWVYTNRPFDYETDLTMADLRLIVVRNRKAERKIALNDNVTPIRGGGAA